MVLWEITLATAYFLGLKRTYRLALRIQRRVIVPKHSKTRRFVHRRTRAVFDVATKFYKSIQERDIKVGQNFRNFILDQMKASAQIRGGLPVNSASSGVRMTQHAAGTSNYKPLRYYRLFNRDAERNSFTPSSRIWPKSFPTIARMRRPPTLAGSTTHCRHLSNNSRDDVFRSNYRSNWSDGVIRKDIMQWMLQN